MTTHKLGSLENPIISKRTAVNVLSVRKGCIVQSYNNSEIVGNRKGTISTLKQNLKTEFSERVKNLSQCDTLFNINEHTSNIIEQHQNHQNKIIQDYHLQCTDYLLGKTDKKPQRIDIKDLGLMSINQVKSVRRCLENMVTMVLMGYKKSLSMYNQPFLTFVTLTLPSKQIHSDKILRKSQTRFIENLQKTYKVVHYVWKAETQQNGNIHFHLLIDKAIPFLEVQKIWNYQLDKLGYIEEYRKNRIKKGFDFKPYYIKNNIKYNTKTTKKQQFDFYQKELKDNFSNPNTTDIHSLKGIGNTVSYLMKYMTKLEPTKRPIIGALWGASNLTKKLTYPKFYETEESFNKLIALINSKRLKCVLLDDFCGVFCGKIYDIIRKEYNSTIWRDLKNHYKNLSQITSKLQTKINDSLKLTSILKTINNRKNQLKKPFTKIVSQPSAKQLELFYLNIYGNLAPC